MNAEFNLFALVADASLIVQFVMLSLLICSLIVWYVAILKFSAYRKVQKLNLVFEKQFWSSKNLWELFNAEKESKDQDFQGIKSIFFSGFNEYATLNQNQNADEPQDVDLLISQIIRKMKITLNQSMNQMEERLNLLATIGTAAPYIGLFGTVWGIIHAFHALGQVKHATLALVAPGISEALIATAMGLFVAIPAVIFYNRLSERLNEIDQNSHVFIEEFSGLLEKQLKIKRT